MVVGGWGIGCGRARGHRELLGGKEWKRDCGSYPAVSVTQLYTEEEVFT